MAGRIQLWGDSPNLSARDNGSRPFVVEPHRQHRARHITQQRVSAAMSVPLWKWLRRQRDHRNCGCQRRCWVCMECKQPRRRQADVLVSSGANAEFHNGRARYGLVVG